MNWGCAHPLSQDSWLIKQMGVGLGPVYTWLPGVCFGNGWFRLIKFHGVISYFNREGIFPLNCAHVVRFSSPTYTFATQKELQWCDGRGVRALSSLLHAQIWSWILQIYVPRGKCFYPLSFQYTKSRFTRNRIVEFCLFTLLSFTVKCAYKNWY